jgi:ABC-2 type transport system permease protein
VRNIWAMCVKEMRIYMTTATSYVLMAAFLIISAFFFQRLVIEFQLRALQAMQMQDEAAMAQMNLTDWIMAPLFLNITVFFLFMLPILTMRLLAEERRQKTLELLMTAPIRPIEIVLGKFASGVLVMLLMLGSTVIFPVLLQRYGGAGQAAVLDWHCVASAYLGMALLGASFVAVGLFASALSDSQIVSVIVGFATLLLFYVIGLAARGQEGFWQSFLQYLSINTHLEGFVHGVIRSTDVVYYLSLTFVGLFMTHQVVEAQRWR